MAVRTEIPRPTARQLDCIRLVAEGLPNREIAARLELSTETVRTYLGQLYDRIGARDRAHAVHLCWKAGVFTADDPED